MHSFFIISHLERLHAVTAACYTLAYHAASMHLTLKNAPTMSLCCRHLPK